MGGLYDKIAYCGSLDQLVELFVPQFEPGRVHQILQVFQNPTKGSMDISYPNQNNLPHLSLPDGHGYNFSCALAPLLRPHDGVLHIFGPHPNERVNDKEIVQTVASIATKAQVKYAHPAACVAGVRAFGNVEMNGLFGIDRRQDLPEGASVHDWLAARGLENYMGNNGCNPNFIPIQWHSNTVMQSCTLVGRIASQRSMIAAAEAGFSDIVVTETDPFLNTVRNGFIAEVRDNMCRELRNCLVFKDAQNCGLTINDLKPGGRVDFDALTKVSKLSPEEVDEYFWDLIDNGLVRFWRHVGPDINAILPNGKYVEGDQLAALKQLERVKWRLPFGDSLFEGISYKDVVNMLIPFGFTLSDLANYRDLRNYYFSYLGESRSIDKGSIELDFAGRETGDGNQLSITAPDVPRRLAFGKLVTRLTIRPERVRLSGQSSWTSEGYRKARRAYDVAAANKRLGSEASWLARNFGWVDMLPYSKSPASDIVYYDLSDQGPRLIKQA